jgi:three-Cys-motif partner protein
MSEDFFDEQLPGSKVKSSIVVSYFIKWARVMANRVKGSGDKIAYIDLFCGPGKYDDDSDSTPLLILKEAIKDPNLSRSLITLFNDMEPENVRKLKEEAEKLPEFSKLKHIPVFMEEPIGKDVVAEFKKLSLVPSLVFIDPFGYKGLSLDLIGSVIKDWGCDCIFFFNYNRINAAITNPVFKTLIDELFGEDVAGHLRKEIPKLTPPKREEYVKKSFEDALKNIKGEYSISFKFFKPNSQKTSHFIYFVSKHPLAYFFMKQSMADNCKTIGGVPTYMWTSSTIFDHDEVFNNYQISNLATTLATEYAGKIVTRKEIYEKHSLGKPFIESNYKDALLILEQEAKIAIEKSAAERRVIKGKLTLAENLKIKFL